MKPITDDWRDYVIINNNGRPPTWPVKHGEKCKCNECK